MESECPLAFLKRFQKKIGLTYKTLIGDGDSKSYAAISKVMPYGPLIHIVKEECVSHMAKQMGTGLREIVKRCKGSFNI